MGEINGFGATRFRTPPYLELCKLQQEVNRGNLVLSSSGAEQVAFLEHFLSSLEAEKEDHAILNGLPLSFPPRSCGFNHSGRSSMASVHMVASFEVADSVRLGPSELQMHFFFKANQVMRTGVGLFFRCCAMFVLVVFFSLLRSLA